jgi:plastocyanin
MNKWKTIFGLLIVALVVAACAGQGSSGGTAPTPAAATGGQAEVVMRNRTFQPAEITVAPGTKVTWTNEDNYPHTVTSGTRNNPTGLFDSGNVAGGATFSYTFEEPGTYPYYCRIHQGMDGTVIVK